MSKYNYDSKRADYWTPHKEIINPILEFINSDVFDIDVCCSTNNIPAERHFTPSGELLGENILPLCSLSVNWWGICWMNPPYRTMAKWIEKAYNEACIKKTCEVWAIFPARTETKYWHDYIAGNPDCFVVFLRKGLSFINPETGDYVRMQNGKKGAYKHPLAIVYFGRWAKELAMVWNEKKPMTEKAWRIEG